MTSTNDSILHVSAQWHTWANDERVEGSYAEARVEGLTALEVAEKLGALNIPRSPNGAPVFSLMSKGESIGFVSSEHFFTYASGTRTYL
jgi:hypothetical protein